MLDRRKGVSIVEALVAMVVIGVLTVSVARLLAMVAQLQRASQRRMVAISEVANFAENLAGMDYDELTPAWAASRQLSDSARAVLPAASFRVNVIDANSQPTARQVRIELDWQAHAGETVEPIRLVTWKYASPTTDP